MEAEEEPQQEEPQQEQPLWLDQVVAAKSFTTWRNEEACRWMKAVLEAAFATLEVATIEHSRESAAKEERPRSLMAAERAAHEELNAARVARKAEHRQERRVLSRLAKTNNDEAGPSSGA